MHTFEMVMAILGIVLVAVSLALYVGRTRDKNFFKRFWLGRNLLTRREYVLNRVGFVLWLVAMLMAGVHIVRTWMRR